MPKPGILLASRKNVWENQGSICFPVLIQVLQRIYLFSDSVGDVDPADVIDLKDIAVVALQAR